MLTGKIPPELIGFLAVLYLDLAFIHHWKRLLLRLMHETGTDDNAAGW